MSGLPDEIPARYAYDFGDDDDELGAGAGLVADVDIDNVEMQRLRHSMSSRDSNGSAHELPRVSSKQPRAACRSIDAAIFMLVFVAFSLFFVGVQLCRLPALAWTFVSLAPVIFVLLLARIVSTAPGHHVCTALYFAVALSTASLMSLVTCAVMDTAAPAVFSAGNQTQTQTNTNTHAPTSSPSPFSVSFSFSPSSVPSARPTAAPSTKPTAVGGNGNETSQAPSQAPTWANVSRSPTWAPTTGPTPTLTTLPTRAPTLRVNATDTAGKDTNSSNPTMSP